MGALDGDVREFPNTNFRTSPGKGLNMPNRKQENKKRQYELRVSYQEDNREARGDVQNQNESHNVKRQALGPNGERDKR